MFLSILAFQNIKDQVVFQWVCILEYLVHHPSGSVILECYRISSFVSLLFLWFGCLVTVSDMYYNEGQGSHEFGFIRMCVLDFLTVTDQHMH